MSKTHSISNQQLAIITLVALGSFLLISLYFLIKSIQLVTQAPTQETTTTSPQQQNVQKAIELLEEKTTNIPQESVVQPTPPPATSSAESATQAATPES